MANGHIWKEGGGANGWECIPLEGEAIELAGLRLTATGKGWLLLAEPEVRVRINGVKIPGLVRVLTDQDEISIGGGRMYFSSERLAAAVPHHGASVVCPRCKQAVKEGDLSVKCPGCGAVHHQSEDFPCWTYADTCTLCPRPTALDCGYQWTPEDL